MLPSSWISVDEGMESKVRRNCNVRVVSCGKPIPLQQEGLEDRPFTNPVRCKMVRGRNNSMSEEFHFAPSLVPDLKAGDAAAHRLNAVALVGPQGSRGQLSALDHQRQGDPSYHDGQHRQSNVHNPHHRKVNFMLKDSYGPMVLPNQSSCSQACSR